MGIVDVVLVGMGGYGHLYAKALLNDAKIHGARLVAGVDPYAEKSGNLDLFRKAGIPVYDNLETFYHKQKADLAVISTAIHLHAPLTCLALAQGSNVLCEKPLCSSLDEIEKMRAFQSSSGKFVSIGYQWSYSEAIQALKKDIKDGILGSPVCLKTLVLWPRAASYYQRNDWAGRIKMPTQEWVLDSPVHNATAHYLHNMLYLLGSERELSAWPEGLEAKCWHVNPIENFDACALHCKTSQGGEIFFFAAHSILNEVGPIIEYQFENASVTYQRADDAVFTVRFRDGKTKFYGDPYFGEMNKLWQAVKAVGTKETLACGIEAASPEVFCIQKIFQSTKILQIPQSKIKIEERTGGDNLAWAEGLEEALLDGYYRGRLPEDKFYNNHLRITG